MGSGDGPALQRRTEHWFIRRGLPHFIDHYNAVEDVFTRAALFLYLVFILTVIGGFNLEWPLWANLAVLLLSLAVVLGALATLNRLRGDPWYRRPRTIGPVELAGFVLVPGILPILGGAHFAEAAAVSLFNVGVVIVVYLVVGYGLLPMTRWAIGRMGAQFRSLFSLVLRAFPLLLIFTMFMFLNAELWKVADEIPNSFYFLTAALIIGIGAVLLVVRLPSEMSEAETFGTWTDVDALVQGSPVEEVPITGLVDPPRPGPLTRRARINVGLVLFFSQAVQIIFVALAVVAFYLALGLLVMQEGTILLWTGQESIDPLATWSLFGHEMLLTKELLRSAGFVALIAGLQFVVTALSDESYHKEFVDDLRTELREAFAVRALYLARVAHAPTGADQAA